MRIWVGLFVLCAAFLPMAPAKAELFNLRCAIEGEPHEFEFLFDTRSTEVLQRRIGADVQLAKYQTLVMTFKEVEFAKYALMGKPKQKFKVNRDGGPLYESQKKIRWSSWQQVGTCTKP